MPGSELLTMLEQRLRHAKATRDRLVLRRHELQREIDLLRTEINEINFLIGSTQESILRLTSVIVCNDSTITSIEEQRDFKAETLREGPTPPLNQNPEVINDRFSNITIPQAATIILSECKEALHVNELYNRMVKGG